MERDKRFFPEVLSQMINNDVDAWEVKFLSLRKVYCEIVIA